MSKSLQPCLRCPKYFLGDSKYCPDCRQQIKLEKIKPKPVKKPPVDKFKEIECKCGVKFMAQKYAGRWQTYCEECREGKRWWRVNFKNKKYL